MKKSSISFQNNAESAVTSDRVFGRDFSDRKVLSGKKDLHDILMDAPKKSNTRGGESVVKPSGDFKRASDFKKAEPQVGDEKVARSRVRRARRDTEINDERFAVKPKRELPAQAPKSVVAKIKTVVTVLFIVLAIAVVVFAVFRFAKPVNAFFSQPLNHVAVEGEFHLLSNQRAMDLINEQIDGHFLQLDLEKLKSGLEAEPWIEHVYLGRRWPDTLVVKITEQKPIARWDTKGFVNQSGELIQVKNLDPLLALPWLKGDESDVREIMQQYQDLSTLLRNRNLDILGLEADTKKSWRLIIRNKSDAKRSVEIVVGRDQVIEKMNRFLLVYDKFLSSVWQSVEAIDLRYTNGVAVRWLPNAEVIKTH